MSPKEYDAWWLSHDTEIDADFAGHDPIVLMLALHVEALQSRIDDLPEELRCCCAYDYPRAICMTHAPRTVMPHA